MVFQSEKLATHGKQKQQCSQILAYTNMFCHGNDEPDYCSTFNPFIINTKAHLPVLHQLFKCVKIQVEERSICVTAQGTGHDTANLESCTFYKSYFLDN